MQREIKKNILSTSRFFFLPAAAFFLLSVDISPGCEIVQTIFDNCRNCINYRSELSVLYSYQSHSYQSEVSSNVDSGTFNLFYSSAKITKKISIFKTATQNYNKQPKSLGKVSIWQPFDRSRDEFKINYSSLHWRRVVRYHVTHFTPYRLS